LGASEIEAKVKYQQLARIYHPDRKNQATTGLTTEEAGLWLLAERLKVMDCAIIVPP